MDPHYRLRVLASVVFINNWSNSDVITFTITPNISFTLSRNSGTSLSDLCNGSGSN